MCRCRDLKRPLASFSHRLDIQLTTSVLDIATNGFWEVWARQSPSCLTENKASNGTRQFTVISVPRDLVAALSNESNCTQPGGSRPTFRWSGCLGCYSIEPKQTNMQGLRTQPIRAALLWYHHQQRRAANISLILHLNKVWLSRRLEKS